MSRFILNNEEILNAHGFIILNAGGNFDRFIDNPVMLDSHNDTSALNVIGKWVNLKVEGPNLTAEPEFDMDDPEAAKISGKVARGYVKGASMGIIINDAELRSTEKYGLIEVVTKWELLEASPVGVPSNRAALRLYAKDGKTILTGAEIKLSINNIIKNKQKMDKINLTTDALTALGLSATPNESELSQAIVNLHAKLNAAEKEKTEAVNKLNEHHKTLAVALVDDAIKAGRITADRKDSFVEMAVNNYNQAKEVLEAIPGKQTFSGKFKTGSTQPDREGWDYMRYLKEAPAELKAMQANEPERFAELKASYKSKH